MCAQSHACCFYPDGRGLRYTTVNTANTNHCFSLKHSPEDHILQILVSLGCMCVCARARALATFLMHVMSLAAMLELITADTCPMPPLACPLLWPRPSFMGHHWHSSDWYVSPTQCCSFWHWTNNHLCPAALTHNKVQYNRNKVVNLRNPLFT